MDIACNILYNEEGLKERFFVRVQQTECFVKSHFSNNGGKPRFLLLGFYHMSVLKNLLLLVNNESFEFGKLFAVNRSERNHKNKVSIYRK